MYQDIRINPKNFILYSILLLAIPAAGFLYLYCVRHYPQYFMPCTLKTAFHLYCPGCGGTHALYYLLHFQILDSLLANPLVLYGVIVLLYYWFRFLYVLIRKKGRGIYHMNLSFLWGLLILLGGLFIVRNLLVATGIYDYSGELISYWT